MKVWVATAEPYHDNSTVLGVAHTVDDAKAMAAGEAARQKEGAIVAWIDASDDDDDEYVGTNPADPYSDTYIVRPFTL